MNGLFTEVQTTPLVTRLLRNLIL